MGRLGWLGLGGRSVRCGAVIDSALTAPTTVMHTLPVTPMHRATATATSLLTPIGMLLLTFTDMRLPTTRRLIPTVRAGILLLLVEGQQKSPSARSQKAGAFHFSRRADHTLYGPR